MGLFLENGRLMVNVSNETRQDFRGRVQLKLCRNDFTVLDSRDAEIEVEALTSEDVLRYKLPETDIYNTYLAADLYDENGTFLMRQVELQVPAKHFDWLQPRLSVEFADVEGGVEITVCSDVFTRGVSIDFRDFDCVLSDNFFSLTDPEPYRVLARTDRMATELRENALIKTVYDIR